MKVPQSLIDSIANGQLASLDEESKMDFEIWKTDKIKILDRNNQNFEEANLFMMWMIEQEEKE